MPADPIPPREITLNTSELRETMHAILRQNISQRDITRDELADRLVAALAASPEPSEPPPGVYRNRNPKRGVWFNDGEGWRCTGLLHPRPWDEIKHLADELVPLFTVDELIPDPDDEAVFNELLRDQLVDGVLTRQVARRVIRSLRERAVSRG